MGTNCYLRTSIGHSDPNVTTRKPRPKGGFSLVELLIIVSLAATVLAVAVPAFVSRLRTSKIAEASIVLEELHRRTAAYYSSAQGQGRQLRCIPLSAGPAPRKARPYRRKSDFYSPHMPGAATWKSIGFHPTEPLRFRYTLRARRPGCDQAVEPLTPLVTFTAEGDLDGDGQHSLFQRTSGVTAQGEFVPVGALYNHNRTE